VIQLVAILNLGDVMYYNIQFTKSSMDCGSKSMCSTSFSVKTPTEIYRLYGVKRGAVRNEYTIGGGD
jgi:hypothetical protein